MSHNSPIFVPMYFILGIGAQTHKTEIALKKGIQGLRKNFTDLADLAIAEFDEADLSPQVEATTHSGCNHHYLPCFVLFCFVSVHFFLLVYFLFFVRCFVLLFWFWFGLFCFGLLMF